MLLHEGHWIGCSTTQLRWKRNSSLNNWCGAAEEPIYFQYFLIDIMLRRLEKQIYNSDIQGSITRKICTT